MEIEDGQKVINIGSKSNPHELNHQLSPLDLARKEPGNNQTVTDLHQTFEIYKDPKYKINGVNVLDLLKTDEKLALAIKTFDKAAEREKVGKMNDAVSYYREAIKIYENVETLYRKKIQYEYEMEKVFSKRTVLAAKDTAIADDSNMYLSIIDQEKQPCLLIDMLPISILNKICIELLEVSQESLIHFVNTCAFLNTNCFQNNSLLFRYLAEKIYENQHYDMGISLRNSKQEKEIMDVWNINDFFCGDYKRMLNKRPYIKFQGVYISVNNYIRQGGQVEGSSSLYNPIHMVTYYRYFRFMPNGDVLRLVTTDEPAKVVKNFKYGTKDSIIAKWSINTTENDLLTIERIDKAGDKCIEQLKIENHTKRLPHNKLSWQDSFFFDSDGERNSFRLKNEKNFYFSKVRSYPVKFDTLM